jgi:hypothetical protein
VTHALALVDRLGTAHGCVRFGVVATRRNPDLRHYIGLVERALYEAVIAWLAMFGIALVHIT